MLAWVMVAGLAACSTGRGEQTSQQSEESGIGDSVGDEQGDEGGTRFDVGNFDLGGDGGGEGGEECEQSIDIVFVMDVSTTMGPFFDELEAEVEQVDAYIQGLDTPEPPRYGLVVFVDDFTVANAGMAFDSVADLQAEFAMWNQFTSGNSQTSGMGSNTTWPENSLDAIYAGATAFPWRPTGDTLRLVIHTTDDTFWDGPTTANGVAIMRGYGETVAALQDREIRQFTFADLLGGPAGNEDVSVGWSTPYQGEATIPEQTGGGWWNINEVLSQQVSLADALEAAIEETMCEDYPMVG